MSELSNSIKKDSSIWLHKFWLSVLILVSIIIYSTISFAAEPFFSDDFESSDMSRPDNDFRWTDTNRVSIVKDGNTVVWPTPSGPWEGRQWENGPASEGSQALRFRYPAGEPMSELRFDLGGAYPELWVSYWLRVPINYTHGTGGGSTTNQKLAAYWTVGYSGTGEPVCLLNMWPNSAGDGGSRSTITIDGGGHHDSYEEWIEVPEDRGRWMHVVARLKLSSTQGAEDGSAEFWRRWEDKSTYTQIAEDTGLDWDVPDDPPGWSAGYLMGWNNGTYDEHTEFLLDDFKVSENSLFEEDTDSPESAGLLPPSDMTVTPEDG